MNSWRIAYALLLLIIVGIPLVSPFKGVADSSVWQWTPEDGDRFRTLTANTLSLCAGTLAIALPAGVLLATLLYRVTFVSQSLIRFIVVLLLFVPLTVTVSSWQTFLGPEGWLPIEAWRGSDARPWALGMGPAIWVHAVAAIPWVTLIVGLGLTWIEPELEEEASLAFAPWRVLLSVTLPRARASILAAALFVILQTASEITVTDMMLVNTLAEEAYTQFTLGEHDAIARTMVIFLPMLVLVWVVVLGLMAYLERSLPPLMPASRPVQSLRVGAPWLRYLLAASLVVVLAVPAIGLLWRVGLAGHPLQWDGRIAMQFLQSELAIHGKDLPRTLGTAFVTGVFVASLALIGCWLARDCAWFRWLLLSVAAWAWVMPGPVVGISVHDIIVAIARDWPEGPWTALLYRGPSPLPIVWAHTIRTLPIAVLFLWPMVRMIPRELFEDARLSGVGAFGELVRVVMPLTLRPALIGTFMVAALCVGEISASARVETPGWESFAKILFVRMHDGAQNTVAALSLLMLGSLALIGLPMASMAWIAKLPRRGV